MLGIVLLALAAVIGLGFGVFAIAKGVANEGTVNVQDSLSTVSSQVFLDYDQKIITGTQAVSGMKNFEGKPYAVLIQTKALAGNQSIASAADHPQAYVIGDNQSRAFLNYNAVLGADAAGSAPSTINGGTNKSGAVLSGSSQLKMENGTYQAPFGFALKGGEVLYDNSTAGIYKSGNAEYIPSSTKFQANVIKDGSGAYVGIVLRQL
jgi:hypothetical protein